MPALRWADYERALRVATDAGADVADLAPARFGVARTLRATGADAARARELARRAVDRLARARDIPSTSLAREIAAFVARPD